MNLLFPYWLYNTLHLHMAVSHSKKVQGQKDYVESSFPGPKLDQPIILWDQIIFLAILSDFELARKSGYNFLLKHSILYFPTNSPSTHLAGTFLRKELQGRLIFFFIQVAQEEAKSL